MESSGVPKPGENNLLIRAHTTSEEARLLDKTETALKSEPSMLSIQYYNITLVYLQWL
jgi:hypothetical protein